MFFYKYFLLSILSIFITTNLYADDDGWTTSCEDLYEKVGNNKVRIRNNITFALGLTGVGAAAAGGVVIGTAAGVVEAGGTPLKNSAITTAGLTAAGIFTGLSTILVGYLPIKNKEERVLDALWKGKQRKSNHLINEIRGRTSLSIEKVFKIIQYGFDSGDFCQKYPRLMGPGKVKKYVINNTKNIVDLTDLEKVRFSCKEIYKKVHLHRLRNKICDPSIESCVKKYKSDGEALLAQGLKRTRPGRVLVLSEGSSSEKIRESVANDFQTGELCHDLPRLAKAIKLIKKIKEKI
ncbi:MAG: hypothetical protein HOE90_04865 [Bacteriovoracaceae bacterium]|jgi:hypothetical protein|nr:hypothetical protein [Bacteriovoracaceae bacterium]